MTLARSHPAVFDGVLKIFFVDLARLKIIYRVAALMGMGVVMMAGAFFRMRFSSTPPPAEGEDKPE